MPRHRLSALGLVLAVVTISAIAEDGPTDFESIVDSAVTAGMRELQIRGAAVSVVLDGEMAFAKGYGYVDAAGTRPVEAATTVFRIASVSKLFVATAVMQLAEQGKLTLDTDANVYLAETGIVLPDADGTPITLTHLLTHTGGFEEVGNGYYRDKRDEHFVLREYLAKFQPRQVRRPGVVPNYSNWSVSTAGLVVETVSGSPYNDYLETNIVRPLGMDRTTIREPLPPALATVLSEAVVRRGDEFVDMPFETIRAPSGAMSSTATDMAIFMLAHLQGGKLNGVRLLGEGTVERMQSQAFRVRDGYPGMAIGFIEQSIAGRRQIGHHGATAWFRSLLTLDPAERIGVFFVANGPRGLELARPLTEQILRAHYGGPAHPDTSKPSADHVPDMAEYVGDYRPARHNHTTLAKVGALFTPEIAVAADRDQVIITSGTAASRYKSSGIGRFKAIDGELTIAFSKDEADNTRFLHDANNPTKPAYRLHPWETNRAQLLILQSCFWTFLLVLGVHLVRILIERTRSGRPHLTDGLVVAMSVCYLLFMLMAAFNLGADGDAFGTGWPLAILLALFLPVAGLVLTLLAASLLVRDWASNRGPLGGRSLNTAATLASVVFLVIAHYWNALGWRL